MKDALTKDEASARLACQLLPLAGPRLASAIIALGSVRAVLSSSQETLERYVSIKQLRQIEAWQHLSALKQANRIAPAWETMGDLGGRVIAICDHDYPRLLREIPDPPPLLSVIGDVAKLAEPQIAIVGSRKMTPAGGQLASRFAHRLAAAGIAITSGLAQGIDTQAHRGALSAMGTTIAVLGTGLDTRYPRSNSGLYDDILDAGGVIVSEYPLGTPPRAPNFPRRNRVITGLSMGTLVVEASERSGSLVSARLAAEQGREVFAVPGSLMSPVSKGCHQLIREGATLVTEPQHILEGISSMFGVVLESGCAESDSAINDERNNTHDLRKSTHSSQSNWLLDALAHECLSADQLCDRTAKSAKEVSSMLAQLELDGEVVASQFGYQRIR